MLVGNDLKCLATMYIFHVGSSCRHEAEVSGEWVTFDYHVCQVYDTPLIKFFLQKGSFNILEHLQLFGAEQICLHLRLIFVVILS